VLHHERIVELRKDVQELQQHLSCKALGEDVRGINQRLDKFASGMLEKMKGDTQLAARVDHHHELLLFLDEVLIRGTSNSSSIKAVVENLRQEVGQLSDFYRQLDSFVSDLKRERVAIDVARIHATSSNWKTIAILLGTFLTALASLFVALLT